MIPLPVVYLATSFSSRKDWIAIGVGYFNIFCIFLTKIGSSECK
jgi:hypothetical protein